MKKFPIIILLFTAVVIIGGVFFFSKNSEPAPTEPQAIVDASSYNYYWGVGCPHCENVEKFINEWEGKDKVKINKIESFQNKKNTPLLLQAGEKCKLEKNLIGTVPLLVSPSGECFSGDTPIIEHLKSIKLNQ